MAARALGRPEIAFEWDAVRAVITRYDQGQQAEMAGLMQAYLGRTLSPYRQDFTALIGQAGESVNGIYEADYRDFNRETYERGRETFDETYAAFKSLLVGTWRRDELARRRSWRYEGVSRAKCHQDRRAGMAKRKTADPGATGIPGSG